MRIDDLRAFEDFTYLDRDALSTVLRSTRIISVPGRRWLVRGRRKLKGRYYLLEGCIERDREAVTAPYRHRLYPGCDSLRSIEPSVLAQVDWEGLEFLFSDQLVGADATDEGWEERFLASPLMQKLSWTDWNRVLAAMTSLRLNRGSQVVSTGPATGDCCYVLASGGAVATSALHAPRSILPGELIGGDALISGWQEECVEMTTSGSVLRLPERVFVEVVLEAAIPIALSAPDAVPLDVCTDPCGVGVHLPLRKIPTDIATLDAEATYAVSTGSAVQRLHAALLLVARGIDACVVLQAGTVRPSAHNRRLAMDSECKTDSG